MSLVSRQLWDYYQYPTITFVSERIANELVFPAITICNLSPRNKSKFNDDPRTDNYYIGISELFHFQLNISVNWSDPFYVEEGYFKNRTLNDLSSESKDMDVFLAQYRFDLQPDKIEFASVATELGICLRGNSERPISTKMYGGLYNLHAYLDLSLEDDYFSNNYMSSGIKVSTIYILCCHLCKLFFWNMFYNRGSIYYVTVNVICVSYIQYLHIFQY